MNKIILATLLVLAITQVSCQAEVTEDEHVIVLTQDNFDQVMSQYENVLVKFYAPWCGHCKNMIPAYSKAAEHFKSTSNTRIAKVDATIHKDLGSKFGVKGFPTLKFFQNGKDVEYQGGRDAEQIISWVSKKTLPPTSQVNSVEEVEKLRSSHKVVVVVFTEEGNSILSAYEAAARQIEDVEFVYTFNSELKTHYEVKGQLVLFKQFDELRNDFEGGFETEAVVSFINANRLALVTEFNQEIAQEVFANNKPAVFFFKGDDEKSKVAMTAVEQAAKALKGQMLFSYATVADGFGKRLGDYVGVDVNMVPTVRIVQNTEDAPQKFALEGEISVESISQLVADFKDGKLKPSLKSEDLPVQNGPVTIVVGKNFEKVVLDTTKDVLIEFYAPWCGHCKTLEPIFDKLGEQMKAHPSVVIAKMDATANEVAGLGIKGFPTLKYFPSNNKAMPGVEYNGGRTLEDFVKYLEENKTIQWAAEEKKDDL